MAEDVIGAALGGEPDEAKEDAAASVPLGLDPAVVAAAAMDAAGNDPTLARKAGLYFDKQAMLVDIQTEHLHEQRTAVLANLKLRGHSERIKIAIQVFLGLVVLVVVVGLLAMIFDAVTSRSVVIETFDAPPALAAQGLSGEVAARQLAARVAAIGRIANAHSIARSSDARADAGTPIKLEIPETGVSLEELRRFLHLWLGHERHISGDLRSEGPDQIAITLRLDGADPIVVRGPSSDPDGLMQTAAERAFAALDPVNSVIYLEVKGRQAEALAEAEDVARRNPGTVTPAEAYSLWSDVDLNRTRAAQKAEISAMLDPKLMVGWMEAMWAAGDLGHAEAQLGYARKLLATRRGDQPVDQRKGYGDVMAEARAVVADSLGDYARSDTEAKVWLQGASLNVGGVAESLANGAQVAIRRHDPALGRRLYSRMQMAGGVDPIADLQLRWLAAANTGDWPAARTAAEALVAAQSALPAATKKTADGQPDLDLATLFQPELALALARTGDIAQARKLIEATPLDCYLCLRVRAQIAAAAGDGPEADRWFAEAVRQAPSIPFAEAEWGDALLARGALTDATEKYRTAHAKAPRWADPLKAWGDVLARQGKWNEALKTFDEALRYAPAWPELFRARQEGAKRAT